MVGICHGGNMLGNRLKRSHITIIITIIMVTIKCRWTSMQASGSLRAFRHLTPASCSTIWDAKMFFFWGQFFSIELKCRWTGMQASGSPRIPSHLTQGGTILCRAVGIGATCHSKGIWNMLHGHQTFIAFNAIKYGAWMKKKYSRDGIWQNCSFKTYFFLENKKVHDLQQNS